MAQTITEALAELKTIAARVAKKRDFIKGCLGRQEAFKDPHEKDGGSAKIIAQERQAIGDLEARIVAIRSAIQKANRETAITMVGGGTKSIQDWLVWRRDIAPAQKAFLESVRSTVNQIRTNAQTKGFGVNVTENAKPQDVIINVDEYALSQEIEQMEETLGNLDGQLSLKNATVVIDI